MECASAAHCPADRAICDEELRACRRCVLDTDCASGVCIEADGACAEPNELVYVSEGGIDAAPCSKAAPCRTLQFAFGQVAANRAIIRILGGFYFLRNGTTSLGGNIIIDGSNTILGWTGPANTPALTITGAATVEGVSISSVASSASVVHVATGGALRVDHTLLRGAVLVETGGALQLTNSTLRDGSLNCAVNATCSVSVIASAIERSEVGFQGGTLRVQRTRIDSLGRGTFNVFGGVLTIENNLFLESVENRGTLVFGFDPGSTLRHNTFVNTSSVTSTLGALACVAGLDVSNNIFAVNSTQPIIGDCVPNHSLFDTAGAAMAGVGSGNVSADVTRFFVDPIGGDFHLAAGSPAIGLGEVGATTTDFDGSPRPQPVGSKPDAGAFESSK
ncbi:MAG: hypothetical protein KIT31_17955 [Deltaproteobacteria bacterium]|nr:hypothetical protein [Deltaproteobacteria bacterium]